MPESLKNITCLFFFVALIPCIPGCRTESGGDLPESDRFPRISPDYTDISIPYNIAPLNFVVKEKGSAYFVRISSENDTAIRLKSRKAAIRIPQENGRSFCLQTGKAIKHRNLCKAEEMRLDKI